MDRPAWNHNLHYHRVLLEAVAARPTVLDVGSGEGVLTRQLAAAGHATVGIDRHEPSVELARRAGGGPEYVLADVVSHPFPPASFDAVVSVATLHHIGTERGLRRMAELVRPGGVVAVLGLARSAWPQDLPRDAVASLATRLHRLTKRYWEHSAPMADPVETFDDVRRTAERVLPGVRSRRHLLWRYSLVWHRPPDDRTVDIRPIGRVESALRDLDEAPRQADEGAPEAWLRLDPEVAAGLDGLAAGDRIVVVTWLHRARRDVLAVHPRSDTSRPVQGVFATRSPDRPNPIGLHDAEVVEVSGADLRVRHLEAVDGTPVLDLKPALGAVDDR